MTTTKAKYAAKLILEGSVRSADELATVTGWPESVARHTLAALHSPRLVEPQYQLTTEGVEWAKAPKERRREATVTYAERARRSRRNALRAGSAIFAPQAPSEPAKSIVQQAIASRSPLAMAWGGQA